MKISKFSIRRPVFTMVTMIFILIMGGVSLWNIPLKLIPDINPPVGVVVTSYPGAGPDEVVDKVTKPLEETLSTLPGLKQMTSTSQENASLTVLEFSWTTDIDEMESDILSRVNQAGLPDDSGDPRFMKFDPSQFPVIQMSLTADEEGSGKLQEIAEELKSDLTKVEGVASVDLSGVIVNQVKVELDQEQLEKYQLTQESIVDTIKANDISLPGDTILSGEKELTTRVISDLTSVDMLKDLVVTVNPVNGEKVTLQDVSDVSFGEKESNVITRTNQKPSIILSVLQQSDANTAEVSDAFKEKLDELMSEEQFENVETSVLFDQGDFVKEAIGSMANALILGGLFAMLVLFLFLRNVKSPLIIGVAIPYSVVVTFVLMYFADFTLNIMTLGGLALGIGMLVDNAIVVIENIYRHLSMGKNPKTAAYDGAKEVGAAITASTLTTVAVFLPVVFISGIIGNLFKEFALTIAFSLLASLAVALTVVPMMASKMLKAPKKNKEKRRQRSSSMRTMEKSIKWALRHRFSVLFITLVLLGTGIYGVTKIGTQFLPTTDEGFFTITVERENGTALGETSKTVQAIENVLDDKEEIEDYVSLVGSTQNDSFTGTGQSNKAEIYVKMVSIEDRDITTAEFAEGIEDDVEKAVAEAELSFNLQSSTGSQPNTLVFNVRNQDEVELNEAVESISESLEQLEHVTEVTNDRMDTVEEIKINVDRDKALEHGLVPAHIAMAVNNVTRGITATQINENNEIVDVLVSYDDSLTDNIDELKGLLIKKADGSFVTLNEVTTIEEGEGPTTINRIDEENAVQFNVKYSTETTLGEISAKVDKELEDLELGDETTITYTGDQEMMKSSMNDLGLAFILSIVFVYLVMAAQFESFKHPFIIMFTVPLIVIGVSLGLILTKTPIGITVVIGLIVLAGIVVNNAIVIVDYINQKKASGMRTFDAIVVSVKDRTRPILMTAMTTILGLLPLALGLGEGTEMQQPMGITVIGGLISSTFLTLFVIPVVYSLVDKETRRMNQKYVTPDGEKIPAYMIDEQPGGKEHVEQVEEERHSTIIQSNYSPDEIKDILEDLLKSVKKEKDDK